ncbi:MAG: permease [Anaerolineales bacterium]|nr:permease [Chloroflexota bacterium]MBL6980765.1 permease [Anaerolineales bacterium]
MNTAITTLWIIAGGLIIYAWSRRDGSLHKGTVLGWNTAKRNVALLAFAFIIVGYVNVLSPTQLVQEWIGPDSGWQGLFLAEIIGMLLPGGPYVVFPLIAVLYGAGAGLGPAVTLVTSWATQALLTITFELPFMGWRFTAIRWGLGLIVPVLAGAVAQLLFS